MRLVLCLVGMVTLTVPAYPQYGTANTRDQYGNIVRNTGANPTRNYEQAPVNSKTVVKQQLPEQKEKK
jgi:hypothetical protein